VPPTKGYTMTEDNVCQGYQPENGPFVVSHVEARREIRYAKTGLASKEESPCWTVPEFFKMACDKKKDKVALAIEWPMPAKNADGSVPPSLPLDQWKKWTWGEYYDECYTAAKGFLNLGCKKYEGVMIYGFNSPWWIMAEMSAILAGQLPAGIYPTDTPAQLAYKSKYSDAAVVVCGDKKNFDAFHAIAPTLHELKAIVCWNYTPPQPEMKRDDGSVIRLMTWAELLEEGKGVENNVIDERLGQCDARECAALVFTSGTTGLPKAVMLSHDNLTFQARTTIECIPGFGNDATVGERILSYLPLSHVAGTIVDVIIPISVSCVRPSHAELYFVREYDLKAGSLGDRLRTVRPTSFLGVPRVWEKMAAKVQAVGAANGWFKKKLGAVAKRKGLEYQTNQLVGGSGKVPSGYNFWNKLVLSKVQFALGLNECKMAITGAAPMPKHVQEYFGSLGICINDAYGSSECGGATTCNTPQAHMWGTIGPPLPGTEVRVFSVDHNDVNTKTECPRAKDQFEPTDAEQGEICYRGRHIMLGYRANPKLGNEHVEEIEKKNRESIDSDGFYHSGDMGCCGQNEMFCITGRYKELIIGSGGENISPVPIEDNIKDLAKGISNIVMIGDQRKYNIALVTLRAVGATGELPGNGDIDPDAAKLVQPTTTTIEQACKDKTWIKHIEDAIAATNKNGHICHSNAFKIQKFTILNGGPERNQKGVDLSVLGGELTPTLKLKRAVVDKRFKRIIDHVYNTEGTYVECPVELLPEQQVPEGTVAQASDVGVTIEATPLATK